MKEHRHTKENHECSSAGHETGQKPEKQMISRRHVLKMAGAGAVGLLFGSVGTGAMMGAAPNKPVSDSADNEKAAVPFYGTHQAGIVTPMQNFLCFASFDFLTGKAGDVAELLRTWTDASARMCAGQAIGDESGNLSLPPTDTGEAAGLSPSKLTMTFGVGPSFFDHRFGLSSKRPKGFADLPGFAGDNLHQEWCGGDIGVQVCADDLQVAFHAVRNLARLARGVAVLRWLQEGFQRTGTPANTPETPRNLLGFKDGTGNPDTKDADVMKDVVWVQPSDQLGWMRNGSFMAVRRIRMRIEVWDRSTLKDQEATFGRHRDSGAPLGSADEFDPLKLDAKDGSGQDLIPERSHVRLARGDGKVKILRRSFSYSSGIDLKTGQLDAGLFFISYQRNLQKQFIPLQERLAKQDKLNEYISHVGSAVFACFPGVRKGGYLGEGLF